MYTLHRVHQKSQSRTLKHYSVFTVQCYACTVLVLGLCPCLSVCLSEVGVPLKWLNVGSVWSVEPVL